MTRFSITLDQGVEFVIRSLEIMWGGELFVPKIPSYRIMDMASAIAPKAKYKIVGIRQGEKFHQEMITETDALNCIDFEEHYVILPSTPLWDIEKFKDKSHTLPGVFCSSDFSYNSGTNDSFLSVNQLKKLIKDNTIT